jgi:hypothetical protein
MKGTLKVSSSLLPALSAVSITRFNRLLLRAVQDTAVENGNLKIAGEGLDPSRSPECSCWLSHSKTRGKERQLKKARQFGCSPTLLF